MLQTYGSRRTGAATGRRRKKKKANGPLATPLQEILHQQRSVAQESGRVSPITENTNSQVV